ncbi:MAG: hypothetical protein V1744_03675 [Candidatus Altiarchaeota archaeon]
MAEAEKIDGKFLFWVKLPVAEPKSWFEKVLFRLGFVTREYLAVREEHMLEAYNRHIMETVIRDRKILMEKLVEDRAAVGEGLLSRVEELRQENRRLTKEFEELKGKSGGV